MQDLIQIKLGMMYYFEYKLTGKNLYYFLFKSIEELRQSSLYATEWQPNLPAPNTKLVLLENDYFIVPNEPFMIVDQKLIEQKEHLLETKFIKVLLKDKIGWLRLTEGSALKLLEIQ